MICQDNLVFPLVGYLLIDTEVNIPYTPILNLVLLATSTNQHNSTTQLTQL